MGLLPAEPKVAVSGLRQRKGLDLPICSLSTILRTRFYRKNPIYVPTETAHGAAQGRALAGMGMKGWVSPLRPAKPSLRG